MTSQNGAPMPDALHAYTVTASIDRHGRRLLPDPFVVDGHHGPAGTSGRGAARTVTVHVWADDAGDDAEQLRRAHPHRPVPRTAGLLRVLGALLARIPNRSRDAQARPDTVEQRR